MSPLFLRKTRLIMPFLYGSRRDTRFQILEYNNEEKTVRQAARCRLFDVSQKGNGENIRNETINGKPVRFRSDMLEDPLKVRREQMHDVTRWRRELTSKQLMAVLLTYVFFLFRGIFIRSDSCIPCFRTKY